MSVLDIVREVKQECTVPEFEDYLFRWDSFPRS